jgi:hypothetical protein
MSRYVRLKVDVDYVLPAAEYAAAWKSGKGDTHGKIKAGTVLQVAKEPDEDQELALYYKHHIVFVNNNDVEPAPPQNFVPPYAGKLYGGDDEIPF